MRELIFANLSYSAGLLLFFGAAMLGLGGALLVRFAMRMQREDVARRVDLILPRIAIPEYEMGGPSLNRIVLPQISGDMPVRNRQEIIRRLGKIGISPARALFVFSILRVTAVAVVGGLGYLFCRIVPALSGQPVLTILLTIAFAIGGWFASAFVVTRLVKSRTKSVARGLPDALELLVVCVEAGLALEDGLERIVIEMQHSHPALAEELALTAADLKILPSRDRALANLAERVDVPSVRSVVTTLSQTMRYGTPLAQAMRTVASEMRSDSLLELEERANRLPTLLTLPMMLFIMPTIFLIVGGPAALRLIDTFFR